MREYGHLYIGYDGEGDVEQVVIGEMVADTMRRQGLKVTWDGYPPTRVLVEIDDAPTTVSPTFADDDLADVEGLLESDSD